MNGIYKPLSLYQTLLLALPSLKPIAYYFYLAPLDFTSPFLRASQFSAELLRLLFYAELRGYIGIHPRSFPFLLTFTR